jgi:hypothetical protein
MLGSVISCLLAETAIRLGVAMPSLIIFAAGAMHGPTSVVSGIMAVVIAAQRTTEMFVGADSRLDRAVTTGL